MNHDQMPTTAAGGSVARDAQDSRVDQVVTVVAVPAGTGDTVAGALLLDAAAHRRQAGGDARCGRATAWVLDGGDARLSQVQQIARRLGLRLDGSVATNDSVSVSVQLANGPALADRLKTHLRGAANPTERATAGTAPAGGTPAGTTGDSDAQSAASATPQPLIAWRGCWICHAAPGQRHSQSHAAEIRTDDGPDAVVEQRGLTGDTARWHATEVALEDLARRYGKAFERIRRAAGVDGPPMHIDAEADRICEHVAALAEERDQLYAELARQRAEAEELLRRLSKERGHRNREVHERDAALARVTELETERDQLQRQFTTALDRIRHAAGANPNEPPMPIEADVARICGHIRRQRDHARRRAETWRDRAIDAESKARLRHHALAEIANTAASDDVRNGGDLRELLDAVDRHTTEDGPNV